MFNLNQAVKKHQLFEEQKVTGLPERKRQHNLPVKHVDISVYEQQAEREGRAISKAYRSRTMDFGKRLKRKTGQRHFPGGFAK